ncbi:hypothetical protein BAE44_0022198 [Dichanthelium oligosanthes]|uniref:FBD domain-containing protein n=1 Tax=Dichanthelium oligosanthes TaxID=888268 RepID=A0A1E5UVE9_9POAL|nr:hypothetical protein BAE44_0022198 [Dichanthelium oligosanthes]
MLGRRPGPAERSAGLLSITYSFENVEICCMTLKCVSPFLFHMDLARLDISTGWAPEFGDRQAGGRLQRAIKYRAPDPAPRCEGLTSGLCRLKRLHLCDIFLDNHFGKHVSSVCLTLEDLELYKCSCKIQSLTSHSVKTLVPGKEPRIQEFKNLRNLLLDNCNLSDDFHILVFFLQRSPILGKLTLRRCQFPKYSNKKKGMPISNKTSSSELHGLDLLCENLKVEIIYEHGNGPRLVRLLRCVSVNLSKNNIKLTKVD